MCKRKWEETIAEVRKRLNNGRELQYKECLHLGLNGCISKMWHSLWCIKPWLRRSASAVDSRWFRLHENHTDLTRLISWFLCSEESYLDCLPICVLMIIGRYIHFLYVNSKLLSGLSWQGISVSIYKLENISVPQVLNLRNIRNYIMTRLY